MRFMIRQWSVRFGLIFLAAALLAGCAAGRGEFKKAEKALLQGNYDQAVSSLLMAVDKEPENRKYKLRLNAARDKASRIHRVRGDGFFSQGDYATAQNEYQLAVDLDGSNFSASDALNRVAKYEQAKRMVEDAESFLSARRTIQAKRAVEQALDLVNDYQPALQLKKKIEQAASTVIDGVELEVSSSQPITLNFTDTKLPDVFEILTNLSGINFILDEDVRSDKTTLFLEQATFSQALELLLLMNKLDKKVLNSKTIILFPKTRDKQKQFEDQLIHTFYLSNIDAKKAVNLLRTMLQVRKIYVHEELNAIILRDTAGVIKLASKILEANDRGDSEVVFDLELIEVLHSDGLKLGPKLGAYQLNVGIDAQALNSDSSSTVTSKIGSVVVESFDGLSALYGLPSATFDLLKESGEGEVLANPKIRVRNKEKAKVHIGTREPIITVTTTDAGTISDNVQYVDVGVKLDVEPNIQLDNTIVTKLGLEVSNVSGRTTTKNGTAVLTISTTNANTALTLKDGESTIIGGLLRDTVTESKTSVPVLGDIPLLGWLFTSYSESNSKSEILLSITPHIVKSVSLPEHNVASIWSGGEDDLKYGRNFGTFADDFAAGQKGVEPEVQSPEPRVEILPTIEKTPEIEAEQELPPENSSLSEPAVVNPSDAVTDNLPSTQETEAVVVAALAQEQGVEVVHIAEVVQPPIIMQPQVYVQGAELVNMGDEFTLEFYVDEITDLFSAPLYVQYDQKLFEFISAEEGIFLRQGASPTIFTHTALADSGKIIVGLKQGAGGKGISGGGELFIMNFKAKAIGVGFIEPTRTNFRNPQGTRLNVDSVGLEVEVQ